MTKKIRYVSTRVRVSTYKKLKLIAVRKEITFVQLVDLITEFYLENKK